MNLDEGFRPTEPGDRVIVLEAIIDAKGNKLPTPTVCHGYANCCCCPACSLRAKRCSRPERIAA